MKILDEARDLLPQISKDRRYLHQHPELAFNEFDTARFVANRLETLGFSVTNGIGKTGVIGLSQAEADKPVIMLRFDMDALPILEDNEVAYKSLEEGHMHACGHDAHIASGLAIADLIMRYRSEFPATIKLVFQPAEEIGAGAMAMIEDSVLENPRPDYVLGMHVWNEKPIGWLGLTAGPVMAGCDELSIKIEGKGGHGGVPNLVKDPILAAANVIMSLQSIVSRNLSPFDSAVLSIGSIHAGSVSNIIPPIVEMLATLRTYSPEGREIMLRRAKEIVEQVSAGMGCKGTLENRGTIPPTINDPEVTKVALEASRAMGLDLTVDENYRTAGSEDMSYFLERIPGIFIFIGSANGGEGKDFPHHHPRFDIDERCLPIGIALMLETTRRLIGNGI
ncbi:MAG TPA: M20 family metallopeptidase [Anaerolineaceae bacterium]|nr:M20 family metallopeptidase [Anaerolineaceae bacterium]